MMMVMMLLPVDNFNCITDDNPYNPHTQLLRSEKAKIWLAICEEGVTLSDEELEDDEEGEAEAEEEGMSCLI
jgi:hypothetical protein